MLGLGLVLGLVLELVLGFELVGTGDVGADRATTVVTAGTAAAAWLEWTWRPGPTSAKATTPTPATTIAAAACVAQLVRSL